MDTTLKDRAAATAGTQAKIKSIEAIAVKLPMAKPMKMAGVLIASADNVLVRIETDEGHVGWGEAASAPQMTGETMEGMTVAVRLMASAVIGCPLSAVAEAGTRLDAAMYGNNAAKAAIEMAWHDALGKATGQPVCALLGGSRRARVPVLWLLGTGSLEIGRAHV